MLMTFLGCLAGQSLGQEHLFASLPLKNVVDSKDIISNLKTIKKSSALTNVIPDSVSAFTDMMKLSSMFSFNTVDDNNPDTDHVPIVIHPFKVVLKSVRQGMPLTTMEFDYNNFTFPINKEERFNSPYTPFSVLYPEPRFYSTDGVPTLEEVYNNPRLIKGFEQAHAHPANREVALRIVEMGKNSLKVIRYVPQLRALEVGEPGIPIEISEMPITISGYPYGDSTIVMPACKFMIPYVGFA
ncbi:uncharacterized protein LOC143035497 [Oratosquilla oratoria]|uniref:uncharacterized protein LOC143035497 n=1 Tax=Oratosquilla oratoria TaxID=337810 RepID=UPI003F75A0E5